MGKDSVDRARVADKTPDGGPVRTCIGCRRRALRRDLLRLVVGPGAVAVPDPTRIAPGRGAHLHPSAECLDLAVRRRAFGRAFRVGQQLETDLVVEHLARMRQDVNQHDQQQQQQRQ